MAIPFVRLDHVSTSMIHDPEPWVQRVENGQNIHEKNGIDHNFNIVLSILNIKKFNNISFFWLSSWWWSKSSKVVFLIIFWQKHVFSHFKKYQFFRNVIFQQKKSACGKPEGTQKKLMSFFSQKKAPAASRRAHKKSFKQHQQHKNRTRTRRTRRKRKESKKKRKRKKKK